MVVPSEAKNAALRPYLLVGLLINAAIACVLFYLFSSPQASRYKSGTIRRARATKPVEDATGEQSLENRRLDFAVIGFGKAGTSSLMSILGNHRQVIMPNNEFPQVHKSDGIERLFDWFENATPRAQAGSSSLVYGLKNPGLVKNMNVIKKLATLSDGTRLVVGIRNPVLWFESYYNYRVRGHYHKSKNTSIPLPHDLIGSKKHFDGLSTAYAKFEVYLQQLAKVHMSSKDVNDVLSGHHTTGISPNPFKVFIYVVDQLKDSNSTRQLRFQQDLEHFLHLGSPLQDFSSSEKRNVHGRALPEMIDICQDKYSDIREILMKQGVVTSDWITGKFIESRDVFVSDSDYFTSLLGTWGNDPCHPLTTQE